VRFFEEIVVIGGHSRRSCVAIEVPMAWCHGGVENLSSSRKYPQSKGNFVRQYQNEGTLAKPFN
jgi:hypothetical protein